MRPLEVKRRRTKKNDRKLSTAQRVTAGLSSSGQERDQRKQQSQAEKSSFLRDSRRENTESSVTSVDDPNDPPYVEEAVRPVQSDLVGGKRPARRTRKQNRQTKASAVSGPEPESESETASSKRRKRNQRKKAYNKSSNHEGKEQGVSYFQLFYQAVRDLFSHKTTELFFHPLLSVARVSLIWRYEHAIRNTWITLVDLGAAQEALVTAMNEAEQVILKWLTFQPPKKSPRRATQ